MKVYVLVCFDGAEDQSKKFKVDIPSSWTSGPCKRLMEFLLKTANSKYATSYELEDVEFKCCGIVLKPGDTVSQLIHEYNDILLTRKTRKEVTEADPNLLQCTNYGCGQRYRESENADDACHCHQKGPVFHDLEKHWACCPDKKAFDWEEFQKIPTCVTCRHSNEPKKIQQIKSEPVTNQPLTKGQIEAAGAASSQPPHSGPRTTGPREFEGAAHMKCAPQQIVDGKAKCRNYGCGAEFVVSDNNDSACRYHKEGPVFWDTYKYWKCCPDKKSADFDDFVKIPGCCTGPHLV